jgi:beta-1,4-mannooligosaccharide/beta-1,4-mannosyl-N-acetylglucosamine phosphorylase
MRPTDVFNKYAGNPIITAESIPYPADLAYNCGATKFGGRYVMAVRVDHWPNGHPTGPCIKNIALAWSEDGFDFEVGPKPILEAGPEENDCVYDPRLTCLEGTLYLCYATDTPHGIRSGLAVSTDGEHFEKVYLSEPDNRNAVMFPERVNGLLVRLDRPFARIYKRERPFDIWLSRSPDGRYWGDHHLLLAAEDNEWSDDKIGPAAPPIRTDAGWLTLYHGVTLDARPACGWRNDWTKLYQAGVMLLDLDDPHRIIGRCREPVLTPDQPYEDQRCGGYRPNVVFPGGLIPEDDGTCKLYYGSADTTVCVATAKIQDLVALCR